MEYNGKDSLAFTAKSTGVLDALWPFDNHYETMFDSSYGVLSYKKRIQQKNLQQKVKMQWEESSQSYSYNKNDTLQRISPIQNIFTSLVKIQNLPTEELDTKWFFIDHEGQQVKARFLLADNINVFAMGDSIHCNHYRLDLVQTGGGRIILDQTDFFTENITLPDMVRQLWVEQNEPKRIIKATVSQSVFKLEALINE